jgi:hypothetical protein
MNLIKSLWLPTAMAALLAACGGGGADDTPSISLAEERTRGGATPGLLVPQKVVDASGKAAGDQLLTGVGALAGGGFAVAWFDLAAEPGSRVRVQRFSVTGDQMGEPVTIAAVLPYVIDRDTHARVAVAVLTNGTMVVAHEGGRELPFEPGVAKGIFMQLFSAAGQPQGDATLVMPDVPCDTGTCGYPYSLHNKPALHPLRSGGFILAANGGMSRNEVQRFDSLDQPTAPLHMMPRGTWAPTYSYKVDAHDGFTAYMQDRDRRGIPQAGVEVVHYDASNVRRHVAVSPSVGYRDAATGVNDLVWLGNRYVLLSSDYDLHTFGTTTLGTFSQTLDATGQPVGERQVVPVRTTSRSGMALSAVELSTGAHAVLARTDDQGSYVLQQYDVTSLAQGRPIRLRTGLVAPDPSPKLQALSEGALVMAWTEGPPGGGQDVLVQSFVDTHRGAPNSQARRMACLAEADAQQLTGATRQDYVRRCTQT